MPRSSKLFALAVACCTLLPGSAGAATVVNGGFETGNLQGWQVSKTTPAGSWYA